MLTEDKLLIKKEDFLFDKIIGLLDQSPQLFCEGCFSL